VVVRERGKESRHAGAGPREGEVGRTRRNSGFFIYSNIFPMSLNYFEQKVNLPCSKKFRTKYVFEGNQITNKFPYRKFSNFGVEFKFKIQGISKA
jgi:hypothetical protein